MRHWIPYHLGIEWGTKLYNRKSPLKAAICLEGLQHIKAIEATNVEATSLKRLTEIFYKTLMKPVQGNFNGNIYTFYRLAF